MNDIFRSQFRLPADLAERLRVAADEAGRSLNAEIVVRLEGSFRPRGTAESVGDAIQQYLVAAQHESAVLALQADMVKLKYETLMARMSAISAQAELLAKTAQTDEDFAKADAKVAELDDVEKEGEVLRVELEQLLKRRMDVLQSIQAMQATVAQKVSDMEEGLARYKASRASPSR